jgi:hypothetical protein
MSLSRATKRAAAAGGSGSGGGGGGSGGFGADPAAGPPVYTPVGGRGGAAAAPPRVGLAGGSGGPARGAPASSAAHQRVWCLECYNPRSELLEYDYTYDDSTKPPQPYPRIRERGEYYVDSYNDQPWSWTFGTHESVRRGVFCLSVPIAACCRYRGEEKSPFERSSCK